MSSEVKNSNLIIGSSKRIRELEIAENDFYKNMTWYEAKAACEELGPGWRLPTKKEFKLIYKNRNKIDGFFKRFYWSSEELNEKVAWFKTFQDFGDQVNNISKGSHLSVHAVRTDPNYRSPSFTTLVLNKIQLISKFIKKGIKIYS